MATVIYKFRYFDTIRRKTVTSKYHATREEIEADHPGAEILEHTAILVENADPATLTAGHVLTAPPDRSVE